MVIARRGRGCRGQAKGSIEQSVQKPFPIAQTAKQPETLTRRSFDPVVIAAHPPPAHPAGFDGATGPQVRNRARHPPTSGSGPAGRRPGASKPGLARGDPTNAAVTGAGLSRNWSDARTGFAWCLPRRSEMPASAGASFAQQRFVAKSPFGLRRPPARGAPPLRTQAAGQASSSVFSMQLLVWRRAGREQLALPAFQGGCGQRLQTDRRDRGRQPDSFETQAATDRADISPTSGPDRLSEKWIGSRGGV